MDILILVRNKKIVALFIYVMSIFVTVRLTK